VAAGTELDRVLARVRSLYLGAGTGEGAPVGPEPPPWAPELSPVDEAELAKVMALLRAVAAGVELSPTLRPPPEYAVDSALGGSELVMRWRYLDGRRSEIPELLPSALFVITIHLMDRDEALRLADEVHRFVTEV
jgi:hypothetical protein